MRQVGTNLGTRFCLNDYSYPASTPRTSLKSKDISYSRTTGPTHERDFSDSRRPEAEALKVGRAKDLGRIFQLFASGEFDSDRFLDLVHRFGLQEKWAKLEPLVDQE